MHVAEQAGVDPASWTSIDAMFADMDKVKAAGLKFMGMGGNTFQAGYLTHALIVAVAGPETYRGRFWYPTAMAAPRMVPRGAFRHVGSS